MLCALGVLVLSALLLRGRGQPLRESRHGVVLLWAGIGGAQILLTLWGVSQSLEHHSIGLLVVGLALLVGFERVLWRPRGEARAELGRVALLVIPGVFVASAAAAGTRRALAWSELRSLLRMAESGLGSLPLVVSPAVAYTLTYLGLWCLLALLLPGRQAES